MNCISVLDKMKGEINMDDRTVVNGEMLNDDASVK